MKRLLVLVISAIMLFALVACDSTLGGGDSTQESGAGQTVDADKIKVGIIYVGDEKDGYTESHMKGISRMKETLGLKDDQLIEKTLVPEGEACYEAAADLAAQGCHIIFANSFGHEDYMIRAAEEHPDIQFCQATGYQAASSGLANMHNYYDDIHEARYVSGVAAGLKLNEMIKEGRLKEDQAKIGYVAAFPYAEVISGFSAFYLGAKSQCPSVTMEVKYTGSWGDAAREKECAQALIADRCVLIGQHTDTAGAAAACKARSVPFVGYNVDMVPAAPGQALTSAVHNWAMYYTYAVQCLIKGETIVTDYSAGLKEGSVMVTPLNDKVMAEGTREKVDQVEKAILDGSVHVFDTSTFTVGGRSLEELLAEGDETAKDVEDYIRDGYYHESDVDSGLISAPSFRFIIDGIDCENTDE